MEWADIIVRVPQWQAEAALAVITAVFDGGLYVEDYSDLEEQVQAIAHIDLIEEELCLRPRDVVFIHLYVSPEEAPAPLLGKLHPALLSGGIEYIIEQQGVQQEDWENAWKQHYHPLEVGKRLAVVPSWERYEGDRIQLQLDPGMAFGTGTHETTFLCLTFLDEQIQGGEDMLDIGTGSGILAVAGLLLGARKALGIDIDPLAVRTATENAERNHVQDCFTVACGNLAQKAQGNYDIITANIVADAIMALAPEVPGLLKQEGRFIASGIIEERAAEVTQKLEESGLVLQETRRKNGWVALVAGK